jgi:DNA-binding NarL/FixJ family response regulator
MRTGDDGVDVRLRTGSVTLAGQRAVRAVPGTQADGPLPPAVLTRAVLADDEELMHLAVRALLAAIPGFVLAGSAASVGAAEQLVRRAAPDLLICEADIRGQSGIGLAWWVRTYQPRTRVVILTGRDEPPLAQSALQAGAQGYLLKSSSPDALAVALQQVVKGHRVLDERLGYARDLSPEARRMEQAGLSPRERDVLAEVLSGFGNKMIAERLHISEDTVKSHMKAIFRKLGARDRAHAVALAVGRAPLSTGRSWPAVVVPGPELPPPARAWGAGR